MSFYPPEVSRRSNKPLNLGPLEAANATGTAASFICGSFVRLSLRVEDADQVIEAVKFQSNGCGYMISAADFLSERLRGLGLRDLHGIDTNELQSQINAGLGPFPIGRVQCGEAVIEALRNALADYRLYRIEEFQGEKALICTCFGVSEETIANVIAADNLTEVSEVSARCKAGSGCGSCQMLIQEMIDSGHWHQQQ